jgi:S-adenosylmethionine/arginine decarboxylase-like enzyme
MSHLIIDFSNVKIGFNEAIEILNQALELTDVNILNIIKNRYSNGFSILYLLSESHASLHYWDNGNCSIDLYNCSQKNSLINCNIFREYLFKAFGFDNCEYNLIVKRL